MFATTALRTIAGTVGALIFAGTCLVGATAPAAAAETGRVAHVRYGDLNLSSDRGRAVLDARIRQAARSVCFNGARDVRSMTEANRCVHQAIDSAQPSNMATVIDFKG